jgi:fructuronate reductase
LWAEASQQLTLPADEVAGYREALLDRFGNPRIKHLLAQIAADGSQKLPIRALPVIRAERANGRLPIGALRLVAAWINHLRGAGAPVKDGNADQLAPLAQGTLAEAVPRVLGYLDADLVSDTAVVSAVSDLCRQLDNDQ